MTTIWIGTARLEYVYPDIQTASPSRKSRTPAGRYPGLKNPFCVEEKIEPLCSLNSLRRKMVAWRLHGVSLLAFIAFVQTMSTKFIHSADRIAYNMFPASISVESGLRQRFENNCKFTAYQRIKASKTSFLRAKKHSSVSADDLKKLMDDNLNNQLLYNQERHDAECLAMEKAIGIDSNEYIVPFKFDASDFTSTTFSETLLGEAPNQPFGSPRLLHVSKGPLFSKEECDAVILEAEQQALARGGWQTERHYSHRTTDLPLSALPATAAWLRAALPTKLFPMVAACFPGAVGDPRALRIFDVFVVKYDAGPGGQAALRVHRDSSLVSVTVALNPRADYAGGGMWVESIDQVPRPPALRLCGASPPRLSVAAALDPKPEGEGTGWERGKLGMVWGKPTSYRLGAESSHMGEGKQSMTRLT